MAIRNPPKLTSDWVNKAAQVYDHIMRYPGLTSRQIAYGTGIAHGKVAKILYHDPACHAAAIGGLVPVVDAHYQDAWYDAKTMPLVRVVPIEVNRIKRDDYIGPLLNEIPDDSPVKKSLMAILPKVVDGLLNPSRSVRRSQRIARDIVSEVGLMGHGYQRQIDENKTIAETLKILAGQMAMLSAKVDRLEPGKGTETLNFPAGLSSSDFLVDALGTAHRLS